MSTGQAAQALSAVIDRLVASAGELRATVGELRREHETEIHKHRQIAAAAYVLAGLVDAPLRFLDAFSDAANGEIGKRTDPEKLIPVSLDEPMAFMPQWKALDGAYGRKLVEALRDIAYCRIPGVPDRSTVSSDQVAEFSRERALSVLREVGEEHSS